MISVDTFTTIVQFDGLFLLPFFPIVKEVTEVTFYLHHQYENPFIYKNPERLNYDYEKSNSSTNFVTVINVC